VRDFRREKLHREGGTQREREGRSRKNSSSDSGKKKKKKKEKKKHSSERMKDFIYERGKNKPGREEGTKILTQRGANSLKEGGVGNSKGLQRIPKKGVTRERKCANLVHTHRMWATSR